MVLLCDIPASESYYSRNAFNWYSAKFIPELCQKYTASRFDGLTNIKKLLAAKVQVPFRANIGNIVWPMTMLSIYGLQFGTHSHQYYSRISVTQLGYAPTATNSSVCGVGETEGASNHKTFTQDNMTKQLFF